MAQRDERTDRLESLCKLWGAVKFFHPWLDRPEIDWDRALVEAIPLVEQADGSNAFEAALSHMVACLEDPLTRPLRATEPNAARPSAPGQPEEPVVASTIEHAGRRLGLVACHKWGLFNWPVMARNPIAAAIDGLEGVDGFVFDLRTENAADEDWGWFLEPALKSGIARLLKSNLTLGTTRRRYHSGYKPPGDSGPSHYYSGWDLRRPETIQASGGPNAGKPFVVLVDGSGRRLATLLLGLQQLEAAAVVFEGEEPSVLEQDEDASLELWGGVRFALRTTELLAPDGRVGLHPDASVREGGLEAAKELVGRARTRESNPVAGGIPPAQIEKDYTELDLPPREMRLLALFRLWNVIDLFFPYKELMDRPWDDALGEFIPQFEAADSPQAYALAVSEMTAWMNDSHGAVDAGGRLAGFWGTHHPGVTLKTTRAGTFVNSVLDHESGFRPGDVVMAIDGRQIEARRGELARYIAASTPQALDWRTNFLVLAGEPETDVDLLVRGIDGEERRVHVRRGFSGQEMYQAMATASGPMFHVLPEGFGYIDVVRLEITQAEEAMAAVEGTPAIIFDIRGYPRGAAFELAPMLTDEEFVVAKFRRCYRSGLDREGPEFVTFDQRLKPNGKRQYKGLIAVLIDERAISQAEHSCLAIEGAAPGRVTFVGSPTMGANGDVTSVILPGGIRVNFTGHDVRHADGRQLQRLGIQPGIFVEPTPAGVAAGRDEVLEEAVRFLQEKLGR